MERHTGILSISSRGNRGGSLACHHKDTVAIAKSSSFSGYLELTVVRLCTLVLVVLVLVSTILFAAAVHDEHRDVGVGARKKPV